jgi:3-polyprenyl-4-hydroxybenzoate decarboxylase
MLSAPFIIGVVMPIGWKDLRDWLQELESIGQLKVMRGVSLDDIGAITDVNSKNQGPVLLFDEIPGYKKGFRLLTSIMVKPRADGCDLGVRSTYKSQRVA